MRELEVTFRTEKCGKHDARLIAAIENHDMALVRRICEQSPEVRGERGGVGDIDYCTHCK